MHQRIMMYRFAHCCYPQVDFGSVSELLLYRIDSLDSPVRNVLHLAACLGTEFELVDACMVYDEMYNVMDSERAKAAFALQDSFLIAVDEGIIEESFALSSNDDEEEIEEPEIAQTSLCASLGNISLSLKGYRKSHPAYQQNRRYRFTHDSWKTSILNGELPLIENTGRATFLIFLVLLRCSHSG